MKCYILHYEGAQVSAIAGLEDMINTANRLLEEKADDAASLSITAVTSLDVLNNEKPDVIILPPYIGQGTPGEVGTDIVDWIQSSHKQGALICSVCAGAFILGRTGLLDGRPATTHWIFDEPFQREFPKTRLQTDRLLIDDGDIITAGGLMAWVDLGLKLIRRFMGEAIMLETARFFIVDPGAREQSYYKRFMPNWTHGDRAILGVQQWIQANYKNKIAVEQLASQAAMTNRTFLRRFQKATSFKPSDYIQQLRIAKAREKLELTKSPVDQISWEVGYEDTSAFRKIFRRLVGLSPRQYRQRFSITQ